MKRNYYVKPEQAQTLKDLEKLIGYRIQFVKAGSLYKPNFAIIEDGDVVKLVLFRNNIQNSLPESIGNLRSLKHLYLSGNNITTLPETIGNLSSLRVLDLNYNKLTNLPESIGNLKNLYSLFLDYNHNLKTLPESFSNLKALNNLHLYKTPIFNPQNYDKTTEFVLNHLKDIGSLKYITTPASERSNYIRICMVCIIGIIILILCVIFLFIRF